MLTKYSIKGSRLSTPNNLLTFQVFFAAVFIIVFIFMILDAVMAVISSKGGVMQIHKRSGVSNLLVILLILSVVELAVHIANIYFATTFRSPCGKAVSS